LKNLLVFISKPIQDIKSPNKVSGFANKNELELLKSNTNEALTSKRREVKIYKDVCSAKHVAIH
jgi:hypothetical protein